MGTGADHAVKGTDPDRNHATVRQRADAEPDIDLFLKETQHAIVEDQTDIDIRIGLQEIHQDRDEANAPEDNWGCDDQLAGRRGIFAGGGALGLRHGRENALARDKVSAACMVSTSLRLDRLKSCVRRCDSSSEILRLTVASGVFKRRDAADRLPCSTTARKVDIASRRSMGGPFQNPEG